jgi:ATP-dependent RNA helicase RhlE
MERRLLNSFNDFGLAEPILRALAQENYITPTPIQAQTIPSALSGRDIVGIAQTGTGKTASFALPILHRLAAARRSVERKSCRVLVLSPTRELSGQILDSFTAYGRHLGLSAALAIGGVPMGRQVRALLGGVDVLVATPGRLLDLVRGNALRLNRVEYLVLDEADRMLDMGFIHDIRKIVSQLPSERQTLFFSATMPQQIAELAKQMLRDPVRVSVTPSATTAERVDQRVIHVERQRKAQTLADLLVDPAIDRALVFTRTKHGADKVVRGLEKTGIAAHAIHGNKSQNQRERVLAEFRSGKIRTLVATDIAARGIDVDGISHVVNYDLPNEPETYVHRIGRTARAGADGIAISLCSADEAAYLRAIEKLIRLAIPAQGHAAPARDHLPAPGEPERRNGNGHRAHSGRGQRGRGQNGHGQNGHGQNSHSQNGHSQNGHSQNGHGPNGRGPSPHGQSGRPQKARPPHGRGQGPHSDKGHAGRPARPASERDNGRRNGAAAHGAPVYGERPRSVGNAQPVGQPGHGQPAHDQQGIGTVGFMRRAVPARRDDAGRPPR